MAVTVTDNRTIQNEADATTNWTAAGTGTGVATGTASPTPREAAAHIVTTASSSTPANQWLYHTGSSLGTGPHLIYIWMLTTATIGTRANGGLMILIGDGTNRVGYHVGGDDFAPFRVDGNALVNYMCFVIDTAKLSTWPHGVTVQAGSRATLEGNLNAITQTGTGCQVLAKAVGGAVNYWNDIIRYGVATNIETSGITISGGSSGAGRGTFAQIEVEDRAITDKKAHGIIRQLGEGAFGVQGTLRFGDQGAAASWFEDTDVVVIFEKRDLDSTRYKIAITDNGIATATFKLGVKVGSGVAAAGSNGCSIVAAAGVGWQFDAATDADVTDVFIYGSTFRGASGGVKLRVGHEFIGGVIADSGVVEANGATMVNTSLVGSLAAADASALIWNVNTDPDTHLHGMAIAKGAAAHHAIEFGTTSPETMTLREMDFTGFNAANANNDSTFHVKRTGGTVTINAIDCTGNLSYRSDGATVNIVTGTVTVKVTARDATTAAALQDVRVLLRRATGATVTVSRSGSTATVAHMTHGYVTGQKVAILGAVEGEYNGVKTITVTTADEYTYTVSGAPATPATGTITSYRVILDGLTDVDGIVQDTGFVYTSDLAVTGAARRYTTAPSYKPSPLSGTIEAGGFDQTAFMILD